MASLVINPKIDSLLSTAKVSERGQAIGQSKEKVLDYIRELELSQADTIYQNCPTSLLAGTWELCFATDDITRSSPFFWAFRKALEGKKDNSPVVLGKTRELVDSIFYITDTVPRSLKEIGVAKQTIRLSSNNNNSPSVNALQGELVSEVVVKALGAFSSTMTTKTSISSVDGENMLNSNLLELVVDTTEVVTDNPLINIMKTTVSPALMNLGLDSVAKAIQQFPSGKALELVKSGASRVRMRVTYLDDQIRIIRPENSLPNEENFVFVYQKTDS